jgi:hypothetical protein
MWDLAEGNKSERENVDIEGLKNRVLVNIVNDLSNYLNRLERDRMRQAMIKEKYGINSLDTLLLQLDRDLIDLMGRRQRGENVDLAIRNKEEQQKKYETNKRELEDVIQKEKSLTMSMPSFLGIIRALPLPQTGALMHRDEEIERLGMQIAMEFESAAGRHPEDVSKDNLGFDIRSKDGDGKSRYIEVKARAGIGAVALTQNEWFKAQRLASDYYLYVVWNAGEKPSPRPHVVQDPARSLAVDQMVEIVRYIVPAAEIERKAN